jgi:uridylate kinase
MDASAISLARENDIPIVVFSIRRPGGLLDVMSGVGPQTIISERAPGALQGQRS